MYHGGGDNRLPLLGSETAAEVSEGDPYPYLCDLVAGACGRMSLTFGRWNTLLETQNTAESASFAQSQRNLTRDVIQALDALQHVEMALVEIERDQDRFPHVDGSELKRRRCHCAAVRREIRKVKTKLHSKSTVRKIEADRRKVLVARRCQMQAHSNSTGFGCTKAETKAGFFKGHQREQQIFHERQDVSEHRKVWRAHSALTPIAIIPVTGPADRSRARGRCPWGGGRHNP